MSIDQRLTDWSGTAGEARQHLLPHKNHQLWCPSGLCLLLFCLHMNSYTLDPFVKLLKFTDAATFTGLILDSDESPYRQKVAWAVPLSWSLILDLIVIKKIGNGFLKSLPSPHPPLTIVSIVSILGHFQFLGIILSLDLNHPHTSVAETVFSAVTQEV